MYIVEAIFECYFLLFSLSLMVFSSFCHYPCVSIVLRVSNKFLLVCIIDAGSFIKLPAAGGLGWSGAKVNTIGPYCLNNLKML